MGCTVVTENPSWGIRITRYVVGVTSLRFYRAYVRYNEAYVQVEQCNVLTSTVGASCNRVQLYTSSGILVLVCVE